MDLIPQFVHRGALSLRLAVIIFAFDTSAIDSLVFSLCTYCRTRIQKTKEKEVIFCVNICQTVFKQIVDSQEHYRKFDTKIIANYVVYACAALSSTLIAHK